MRYNNIYLTLVCLIAVSFLGGCGATNSLTLQERQSTESIAISPDDVHFKKTEKFIDLATFGKVYSGMLGGAIGSLIYESNKDKTPEQLLLMHLLEDDMLATTITNAFSYHINGSGLFPKPTVDRGSADAYMDISLPITLQVIERTDDMFKVTYRLDAKLITKDQEVLWQDWAYFSGFNDELVEYTLEDLLAKPDALKHAISITAQLIAIQFVTEAGGSARPLNHQLHLQNI